MIQADLPELEVLSRRLGTCSNDVHDLKQALTLSVENFWPSCVAHHIRRVSAVAFALSAWFL